MLARGKRSLPLAMQPAWRLSSAAGGCGALQSSSFYDRPSGPDTPGALRRKALHAMRACLSARHGSTEFARRVDLEKDASVGMTTRRHFTRIRHDLVALGA